MKLNMYNEESDLNEEIEKLQLSPLEPVLLKTRSNFELSRDKILKPSKHEVELVKSENWNEPSVYQANEKVIELWAPK